MQTISNNIANVNTVGFKAGRTNFEDLISQDYWSNGKIQQIGRGVKVASVQQMFTQGSFMNSTQDTDMAIAGEGFFQVRDRVTNEIMYTRAGNFTFDANGLLETPSSYVLQGWELSIPKPGEDPVRLGAPTDVKVIILNAPPVETSQIKVVANLNADDTSAYIYSSAEFAKMYAHQLAYGPAVAASAAAANAVYNFSVDGSAYPANSIAFNEAYLQYMSANGFILSAGSFYKLEPTYPTLSDRTSANALASAAGYTALGIVSNIFRGSATSTVWTQAFDNAYIEFMKDKYNFSYSASETIANSAFYSLTTTSSYPNSNQLSSASDAGWLAASALGASAAASYTYPSGVPQWDNAYALAYNSYIRGLVDLNGDTLFNSSAQPVANFYTSASQSILNNAKQYASATVAGSASLSTAGAFPYGSSSAKTFYMNTFIDYMSNSGYVFDPSSDNLSASNNLNLVISGSLFTILAQNNAPSVVTSASALGFNNAILAGAGSNYTYPSGNDSWDAAFLIGYNEKMSANGYVAITQINNFKNLKTETGHPDIAQQTSAVIYARTKALTALGPLQGYPISSGATQEPLYASAYNAAYLQYMTDEGFSWDGTKFVNLEPRPITSGEIVAAQAVAKTTAQIAAANAGKTAYDTTYDSIYQPAYDSITTRFAPWQLEGLGFAGAWDATNITSPIDPENYTHANPWTIYDSLGNDHTLMVYYQPNPYMENVWDYIITCDPAEDARKDINNTLVMNGSTFAGVIQKGKITFSADGPDRHGGLVKDIEAQNLDMTKTAAATLTSSNSTVIAPSTSSSMNYASLGGYFTGKPVFSASTGTLVDSPRGYTITWVGNLSTVPTVSGFVWTDTAGNTGTIPIYEKNYTGPYAFGSGLNVNFTSGGTPMRFSVGDNLNFNAHSEQIGWTNLTPNAEGYFDFDVAFVQSASMALHPPYPAGLPTIIQHISLDMGAKNPNGLNGSWILDEQGTTQYASKSINIFSSQDGYPAGSLQRVSIDKDGILTGIYTNGRHQPLYQIGLARFLNPWGLAKLGDNVYMETRWSGTGTINPPGYGGTGTIRANFLEQSNTDLADEIVNMIVTQRGFQANSKVVTTTDTMLAEVIEMKR
jgi:flagellar hook-basal body protein